MPGNNADPLFVSSLSHAVTVEPRNWLGIQPKTHYTRDRDRS
jgi:hypothetical protein